MDGSKDDKLYYKLTRVCMKSHDGIQAAQVVPAVADLHTVAVFAPSPALQSQLVPQPAIPA